MRNLEQLIINEAEKKLRKDIKEFAAKVSDHKFFQALEGVKIILPGKEFPEAFGLPHHLSEYYTDKGLCQVIFEALREDYINSEAYKFYEKVKDFKE